jgi:hypothetical protein
MLVGFEDGQDIALLIGGAERFLSQFVGVADDGVAVVTRQLPGRHEQVRAIERTDGDCRPVLAPLIGQRRAALVAKAALHLERGAEQRRPAARPFHRRIELGPGSEQIAQGLLAHAAIADGGVPHRSGDPEADRAALATAGEYLGHGVLAAKRSVASIR